MTERSCPATTTHGYVLLATIDGADIHDFLGRVFRLLFLRSGAAGTHVLTLDGDAARAELYYMVWWFYCVDVQRMWMLRLI